MAKNGWARWKERDPERAKAAHKAATLRRKLADPERFREQREVIRARYKAGLSPEKKQEQNRVWNLKKNYGLSSDEYAAMLAAQGGVCAICNRPSPDEKRLAVDHDHSTGAVRALLCGLCNPGLGFFEHNPDLLRAAIEYLAKARVAK